MPRSREAIATIKGYYYQFDLFILRLLSLVNDEDTVCIEGIEDVDVTINGKTDAIQCKYYAGTACSPAVVGKAIRPMLRHFSQNRGSVKKYTLYGKYESGQDTIQQPLSVEYIKEKFFTYTENGVNHVLHNELGLNDNDLQDFLNQLAIELNAEEYDGQIETIISQIQKSFSCSQFDAQWYYYNNALRFVKEIATKNDIVERTVSKKTFIEAINKKQIILDAWYIEKIGARKYYSEVRGEYFSPININPADRLFLIQCDAVISDTDLMRIVTEIVRKWSKLSAREKQPFCPYIYLENIDDDRLLRLKNLLLNNDVHIWDGHEFSGADFSAESLVRAVNCHVGVKLKMINKKAQINLVLSASSKRKEVFQFYLDAPFYERNNVMGADIHIQSTKDILQIV